VLDGPVPDPVGPCGAAAAFDRDVFLGAGGFDTALFAYWEDVDLALRLRADGATCRLARDARAAHWHSSTLGSGSSRKNYLMGFGRGYTLRKWGRAHPSAIPSILLRDGPIVAGQLVLDRNLAGVRGRVDGWRAASGVAGRSRVPIMRSPPARTMLRRARRRLRLRAQR
jgi:GT2 family glycosyltransferase